MSRTYLAYGLRIQSEIDLPELPEIANGPEPDVRIRCGIVADDAVTTGGRQIAPFIWIGEGTYRLDVRGVARFLVSNSNDITIMPAPGADEDSIRVFLLGSGLGALLFQRGVLVLHGNALEIDGRCVICLGHSGAGKSTLAAALSRRGYRMLADDVVPIDSNLSAIPGLPRIKLWRDTANSLGIDTTKLHRLRPGIEKYNLPMAKDLVSQPVPVRWIYILQPTNRDGVEVQPLHGMTRFSSLLAHTYRRRVMQGMALPPQHLASCGELAARVHMAQVSRSRNGFDIEGLVEALLADMAASG